MAVFRRGRVWWYDFRYRGIRIRESTRATTKGEARQAEALRKAELLQGRALTQKLEPSPRFSDFARGDFARWCANEHRDRPSTFARYMRSIKALTAFFGNRTLEVIDSGSVEHFKLFRSQQPRKNTRDGRLVSPAAVNRDLAVLRILFNFAIRLGAASRNPVTGIKFLKENHLHMRVLTPEDEEQYLKVASPLLRDVAIVMLETGMRPGEVCRLRTVDLNTRLRSIHVREGKTPSAQRYIPLTQRAVEVLDRRAVEARTEWLFPSPYDPSKPVIEVRKSHETAIQRTGLKPCFRLYDLRHTALSRMAMAGIDLPTLKELAGHSQIQMTMRYVHPTPEHKRRAIDKFENSGKLSSSSANSSGSLSHIPARGLIGPLYPKTFSSE